jgi:hypothetical protein
MTDINQAIVEKIVTHYRYKPEMTQVAFVKYVNDACKEVIASIEKEMRWQPRERIDELPIP